MTFKDLHYSLGKFKTDVRSQLARKNPLQKPDTKALSMWIFEERNDLKAMRVSAYHRAETTKSFADWIDEHDDEDLQDIGGKLTQLIEMHAETEREYIAKYQKYRRIVKTIRERDDTVVSSVREKKRAVEARLHHLYKSNRKSRKIPQFEQELEQLSTELEQKEIELGDYKRLAIREAFYVRFNALHEYAEKSSLIAGFGKYLVDLIDIEPTSSSSSEEQSCQNSGSSSSSSKRPYTKYQESDMIWMDCKLAVEGWRPDDKDERPTALDDIMLVGEGGEGQQHQHGGFLDDDAELLTDDDVVSPPSRPSPPLVHQQQQHHEQKQEQEFNEKWTYAASFEQQSRGHQEEPPPAYTPPIRNVDFSASEKGGGGSSSTQQHTTTAAVAAPSNNNMDPTIITQPSAAPATLDATTVTVEPTASSSEAAVAATAIGEGKTQQNVNDGRDDSISSTSSTTTQSLLAAATTSLEKHYQATDYRDLYNQITQREKNAVQPRPYAEFQQRLQINHHQQHHGDGGAGAVVNSGAPSPLHHHQEQLPHRQENFGKEEEHKQK